MAKCKYCDCERVGFETLIESNYSQYGFNVFGNVGLYDEPLVEDNSVVMEMRCGTGYIRLGDRQEMNCIDHEDKIIINYCPMCGRKLND